MKTKRIVILFLSVVVVVLLSSCMATQGIVRTIEVSGSGEVALTADIASFSIQVSELGKTTSEAQGFANEKMAAILTVLRTNGVAEKDIATTALNLRPSYKWLDNQQYLEGQVASQNLSVTLRDLPRLGKVIDQLGEISGIYLNSVVLDKEDKSAALLESRQLALASALAKAEAYAKNSNMLVGSPITISESSVASNPYSPRAVKMLASEAYDMSTEIPAGSMTVRSTISMVVEMTRQN
ncbi:SIMPL domain-containing protein [Sphaerochaeta sp. PS]|uniref:SIMPL domain-containing protein n=1 Tax=Sphaerochaeta sp. PS TaxID=3076336 RepID=UPI0028A4EB25|nr:SIMPL domain-containing protein [Sphaerochaeta sp. PS]MDT4763081.1 SIMPL domain-containing protein [Sphaerochaeta sp. PS]